MDAKGIELVFLIVGGIAILIGWIYYYSTPKLHNCGSCGKFLTSNAHRYWYIVQDEKVPFCTTCHKKRTKK